MSTLGFPDSVTVQEGVISSTLNGSLLFNFLIGGPRGLLALNAFLFYSSFIVSDGLLLWRCYHVWGQSLWVILIPTILVFAEFGKICDSKRLSVILTYHLGLFVAVTVLVARFGDFEVNTTLFENIETALVFVSLGTTVMTTFLIAYRINAASLLNGSPSKRLFDRAITLVIESAAVYSLVLLIYAVFTIVPQFLAFGSPVDNAVFYLQVLGMAPTVLMARISLTSPHITTGQTITHITGLQFESQPGNNCSGTETGEVRPSILTGEAAVAMECEVKNNSSGNGPVCGREAESV
ncbi:hypothetical protein CVT25_008622 [Psilocybe cyanescens]|uniref:Uncharacterized protein n=1 Tax=Psilocybe cyanescens TaxID=93625 RepID=A0A409XD80_PSICY|nr:hypothetical protein CVT25_008622 [Psilocybe cyanescens]